MEKLFPIMVGAGIVWYVADRMSNGASLLPVWQSEEIIIVDQAGQYNSGSRYVSPQTNAFPLLLTDDPKIMHQYDGVVPGMKTYYGTVEIESSDGKFYS